MPKTDNKTVEFIRESCSGVLSPSVSREEYFSRIVFLAFILSMMIIALVEQISFISMSSFGVRMLINVGFP